MAYREANVGNVVQVAFYWISIFGFSQSWVAQVCMNGLLVYFIFWLMKIITSWVILADNVYIMVVFLIRFTPWHQWYNIGKFWSHLCGSVWCNWIRGDKVDGNFVAQVILSLTPTGSPESVTLLLGMQGMVIHEKKEFLYMHSSLSHYWYVNEVELDVILKNCCLHKWQWCWCLGYSTLGGASVIHLFHLWNPPTPAVDTLALIYFHYFGLNIYECISMPLKWHSDTFIKRIC